MIPNPINPTFITSSSFIMIEMLDKKYFLINNLAEDEPSEVLRTVEARMLRGYRIPG
jgi:hypothetical protein